VYRPQVARICSIVSLLVRQCIMILVCFLACFRFLNDSVRAWKLIESDQGE
jgi:adenylylsulfate kinase-like enzyme